MAYYLQLDGTSESAESSAQVFNSADSYDKLYVEVELEVASGDNYSPFAALINSPDTLFIQYRSFVGDSSKLRLFYSAGGTRLPLVFPNGLPVGSKFTLGILLENNGAGHDATTFIDGVLEATSAQSGNLQYFPRDFRIAPTGGVAVDIYSAKVEFDDVIVNSWTADTAPASGTSWAADVGGIALNTPDDWTFYDAGGGATATVAESSQPFSDSVSTTVIGNISTTVTETAGIFSSSINANVTPTTASIDASIIETAYAFSDSLSSVVTGNISATVTETAGVFSGSIGANVTFAKFAQVAEVNSAFSDSIITSLAIQVDGSIIETNAAFSDALRIKTPSKWVDIFPSENVWVSNSATDNIWTTSATTTNSWLKIT